MNNFKQITKSLDEKSESMKKEIREMKTTIEESEQSTGVVSASCLVVLLSPFNTNTTRPFNTNIQVEEDVQGK